MRSLTSARLLLLCEESHTPFYFRAIAEFERLRCSTWTVSTVEQARFYLQHDSGDLILVDESMLDLDASFSLSWLTELKSMPVVFLSKENPQRIASAFRQQVNLWLPRALVMSHPIVLEEAIEQCLRMEQRVKEMSGISDELDEQKKQVTRLTNLLWQVTPGHELPPWHSQRYMLERLHEEMLRAQRYNQPLSIVLGEIQLRESAQGETYAVQSPPQICYWTAERVNQQRRRSDVVGQYGSQGFLVLLPSTGANGALDCCHRLQQTLESEPLTASELSTVSVRSLFGMASTTESLSESRQLLRRAEERLLASHGGTSVE